MNSQEILRIALEAHCGETTVRYYVNYGREPTHNNREAIDQAICKLGLKSTKKKTKKARKQ